MISSVDPSTTQKPKSFVTVRLSVSLNVQSTYANERMTIGLLRSTDLQLSGLTFLTSTTQLRVLGFLTRASRNSLSIEFLVDPVSYTALIRAGPIHTLPLQLYPGDSSCIKNAAPDGFR